MMAYITGETLVMSFGKIFFVVRGDTNHGFGLVMSFGKGLIYGSWRHEPWLLVKRAINIKGVHTFKILSTPIAPVRVSRTGWMNLFCSL